jgi:hypothetical protein
VAAEEEDGTADETRAHFARFTHLVRERLSNHAALRTAAVLSPSRGNSD